MLPWSLIHDHPVSRDTRGRTLHFRRVHLYESQHKLSFGSPHPTAGEPAVSTEIAVAMLGSAELCHGYATPCRRHAERRGAKPCHRDALPRLALLRRRRAAQRSAMPLLGVAARRLAVAEQSSAWPCIAVA